MLGKAYSIIGKFFHALIYGDVLLLPSAGLISAWNDQSEPDAHASIPASNDLLGRKGIKTDRASSKKCRDSTGV
jgi:hypothetical protein